MTQSKEERATLAAQQEKFNPYNLHSQMAEANPAVAATSPNQATLSTSAIVQGAAADHVVSSSLNLQSKINTLGADHPETIAIWNQQPWDGMMTMVQMSYQKYDFQPWNIAKGPQTNEFNSVIEDLRNNDAFYLLNTESQSIERKESDFSQLLNDVKDFFKSASDLDAKKALTAVTNVVNAAATHSHLDQQLSLFVVSSVDVPDVKTQHYRAYYTYVSLVKDKKCGHTTRQDSYVLVSVGFQFATDLWEAYAPEVAQAGMSSLATWLDVHQTPNNDHSPQAKNAQWNKTVGTYKKLSVPLPPSS